MKRIWLTSLLKDEHRIQQVISRLKQYGLKVDGHFWEDNLEKMAWTGAREELIQENTGAWLIYAPGPALEKDSVRYGLSVLMLAVRARKGPGFPVFILTDETGMDPGSLPALLGSAEVLDLGKSTAPARIVARLHAATAVTSPLDYRIDIYGNPQIGQWFEIGPAGCQWQGAMFGISSGRVLFHAVGPQGRLPERTVLNYPLRDMKVRMGDREFTVWAVQNPLTENDSYFVKVEGFPEHCIFGPYAESDETEVYSLLLR